MEGTDQTQILRALMCLYLGMAACWAIAAFKSSWQRVAVIWAVFFAFSVALGRIISLVVDGPASRLLDIYLAIELPGLAVLWSSPTSAGDHCLSDDVGEELILDAGDLVLQR